MFSFPAKHGKKMEFPFKTIDNPVFIMVILLYSSLKEG